MDREPVVSSLISEIGYDASSEALEILFHNGAICLYHFVPADIHTALMSAASHGFYFEREIKGIYEWQRIAEPYATTRPKRPTSAPRDCPGQADG
jgi:KTSC domain